MAKIYILQYIIGLVMFTIIFFGISLYGFCEEGWQKPMDYIKKQRKEYQEQFIKILEEEGK